RLAAQRLDGDVAYTGKPAHAELLAAVTTEGDHRRRDHVGHPDPPAAGVDGDAERAPEREIVNDRAVVLQVVELRGREGRPPRGAVRRVDRHAGGGGDRHLTLHDTRGRVLDHATGALVADPEDLRRRVEIDAERRSDVVDRARSPRLAAREEVPDRAAVVV